MAITGSASLMEIASSWEELGPGGNGRIGGARDRQTRTILEARAFTLTLRLPVYSVRTGQVPLIPNPALITASRNVPQPVLAVSPSLLLSDCLKA